jgi:hypothetical protein
MQRAHRAGVLAKAQWQTGGIFGANSVPADFTTDVTSNRVASESEASANGPLATVSATSANSPNFGVAPSGGTQFCAQFCTQFTCFTSTKVQILTAKLICRQQREKK